MPKSTNHCSPECLKIGITRKPLVHIQTRQPVKYTKLGHCSTSPPTDLNLEHFLWTSSHGGSEPVLEALSEVTNGLGESARYRPQHVRDEDLHDVLVEDVVDRLDEFLDRLQFAESVQLGSEKQTSFH